MKIYPYQTPDGIIELVEKRDYDLLALALYNAHNRLESEKSTRNAIIKKDAEIEQAFTLAFAYLETKLANIAFDPAEPMHFAENVANHVDDLREDITDNAIAMHRLEKAASEVLQDAVKRMEKVGMIELDKALQSQETYGSCLIAVRTRLIQAAKGEQP